MLFFHNMFYRDCCWLFAFDKSTCTCREAQKVFSPITE